MKWGKNIENIAKGKSPGKCPYCGSEVNDGFEYCPKCGKKL